MNDIEDIREESRRRNAGDVAQGHAWGVVVPTLLAERDRLTAENAKLRAFVERIAKQKPAKPDHYTDCHQCSSNAMDADDIINPT